MPDRICKVCGASTSFPDALCSDFCRAEMFGFSTSKDEDERRPFHADDDSRSMDRRAYKPEEEETVETQEDE